MERRGKLGAIGGSSAAEIVESIRRLIDSGSLKEGAALPPIRGLAAELGVNRNTVAAAYAQLAAAGLVETRRRGGTVVRGVPALDGEGRGAARDLVNLADGNPAVEYLPDLRSAFAPGYSPPLYGHPPIDERLAAWVDAEMAPDVGDVPRELVLTHGAADAVERLLSAHLTRGDAVAVEDPCFLSSIGTMRLNGYRSVPVPVDADGMTPDGLAAALGAGVRAVVCTPRAHNPTGASLTHERATRLRELLSQHPEVLVVEDDHFSAISAQPYHRITPTGAAHWALVRSVSKFLGPDLRLALVLCDEDSATQVSARLSSTSGWVSHALQHIVAALLHDTETAQLLQRARDSYAERLRSLTDALHEHGIALPPDRDGLNAWIPVQRGEKRLIDAVAARGWAVRGGSDFAVSGRGAHALRVTTSTISPLQAEAFAADLAAVLHSTKGT
ncbi:aminotransferase class I/II-fold pyridoxal phosphate-dependent enzyme [Saccharopolyspora mangrovi]|uniref:Aminotransferase class I/II-fold pyridoxal phosphate-dependent enzyme n=1 Tax=Saccharopolyspora mangrovi TaxID=3082379 RepID=A0ABU6AC36_9PSEU|nr:aminotransferase class I/II-fold pyridoxal phosphate-dependent enzyme [Saccharopolyspora sp. S2-29]MEB3368895.1 aminotransferase class I/II-fold pyridoxal phosphate-dependent enzyme [Saccharopolyspora sp. S2-29]